MRYPFFLLCLALVPDVQPAAGPPLPPPAPVAEVTDDGRALPDEAGLERLAGTDPVAFLEACLRRYDRTVHGYRATIDMQERPGNKTPHHEVIDACFREQPFSVLLDWREGPRLASRVLFVQGENDNKLLGRPAGLLAYKLAGIVARDPEAPEVRAAGRYTLTGFGIKIGTQRVLAAWLAARKRGELKVEYLGKRAVPEAGNRLCYVLHRGPFARPEEDGIMDLMIYVDAETWLQVGTVLKGEGDRLIGEYFFHNVSLNPDFPADLFTRHTLEK